MIDRLTDAEQLKSSVERVPDYVSENSLSDLIYGMIGETVGDLSIYMNTKPVESGRVLEYEDTDIVLPEIGSFRELCNTDIIQGYLSNYELSTGDTVIDVGAYPGETTVYFADQVGDSGEVIALEPDEDNMVQLEETMKINNLENVTTVPKGLYSEPGDVSFSQSHLLGSCIEENGGSQIEVTTLDGLVDEMGVHPDFVKMDIEGAEIKALEGASEVMNHYSPAFSVASYHEVEEKQSAGRVEEILENNGYNVETGFDEHQTTWGTI